MGRRDAKDEKSAVAELAKMLSISRAEGIAASISKKNAKKVASTASTAAAAPKKKVVNTAEETRCERQLRRKLRKRASNGSSVTVTLKGGINALTKSSAKEAAHRGNRSEIARIQAAETARLYMVSAQEQADSAGLSTEGGDQSEHAQYLLSQRLEASVLLRGPKVIGAHLATLAGKTTLGQIKGSAVVSTRPLSPPSFDTAAEKAAYEDALVQESLLTGNAVASTPDAVESTRSPYYFALRSGDDDHTMMTPPAAAPSALPGRCIMRCKGPAGTKATSLLSTQKSATYLKSALVQTIRKEMFSVLIRDNGHSTFNGDASNASNVLAASTSRH